MTWWKTATVYEIYPRSFKDSNADGIGDLQGIISKVDYLVDLGVEIVWLSPIYASPQDDNGYDISNYQEIDETFGTLSDFDELVEALHSRGLKIMMDLVVNHTSDEHEWFKQSASSKDNPRRDWYIWRDPKEVAGLKPGERGTEPNNWESAFSGSAWQYDEQSKQFYLHLFSRKQPDLNWENEAVRSAIYEMMRWWIRRGVDGFRMDVINLISKPEPMLDGPETVDGLGSAFEMVINGPRFHEFLQEMHREVFDQFPQTFINVGETPGIDTKTALLVSEPKRKELDMVFQFEHVGLEHQGHKFNPAKPFSLFDLANNLGKWQKELATGWNSLYFENHDQPRSVSRFGSEDPKFWARSAKALAGMLHSHRGTAYVYQGQELGQINYPWAKRSEFRDLEVLNFLTEAEKAGRGTFEQLLPGISAMNRDNARTPMQWNSDLASAGGFTANAVEPWIAANPALTSINAAAQQGVAGSVFEFYKALINLRKTEALLVEGSFTLLSPLQASPASQLWAIERRLESQSLLALANFSEENLTIPAEILDASEAQILLSNLEPGQSQVLTKKQLLAWEFILLKLN